MRVRDWLYVIYLWCLSVGCFHVAFSAWEHGNTAAAIAATIVAVIGCYLSLDHWWYRSGK